MQLRDYQIEAKNATLAAFESSRSALIVKPTGCGKTATFGAIAKEMIERGRVLIAAHTQDLIYQTANRIKRDTGIPPAIEMGEHSDQSGGLYGGAPVVVGSVQTLSRCFTGKRAHRFKAQDFALTIFDEAHRAARKNKMYRSVVDFFAENADHRVLGVTATPDRSDESAIIGPGKTFEILAYEYPIYSARKPSAITDSWLVPITANAVHVDGLDFSALKVAAGDFKDSELAEIFTEESILHRTAKPTAELVGDRQTAIFCATIDHAEAMAKVMTRYGNRPAVCVHGKLDRDERNQLMRAYANGDAQFMVSVDALIEGWDDPPTSVVAICRPTKSRCRYAQMIGRGTRPLPECVNGIDDKSIRATRISESVKPNLLVLDYVGCSADLKLTCSVADILANAKDDDEEEVVRIAKEIADNQPGRRADEIIEEAKALFDDLASDKSLLAEQEKWERRRGIIVERANYRVRSVDPFDTGSVSHASKQSMKPSQAADASEKQISLLVAYGVEPATAETFSKQKAGAIIDSYKRRGTEPDFRRSNRWKRERNRASA